TRLEASPREKGPPRERLLLLGGEGLQATLEGMRVLGRGGAAAGPLVGLHQRRMRGARELGAAMPRQALEGTLQVGGLRTDGRREKASHDGDPLISHRPPRAKRPARGA